MERLFMEWAGALIILSAHYACAAMVAGTVAALVSDFYRATVADRIMRAIVWPLFYAFALTFAATMTVAVYLVHQYR